MLRNEDYLKACKMISLNWLQRSPTFTIICFRFAHQTIHKFHKIRNRLTSIADEISRIRQEALLRYRNRRRVSIFHQYRRDQYAQVPSVNSQDVKNVPSSKSFLLLCPNTWHHPRTLIERLLKSAHSLCPSKCFIPGRDARRARAE